MSKREYLCVGGPRDGKRITLSAYPSGYRVAFPVAPNVEVKLFDEIEWEEDPLTGLPRPKLPPFGQAEYEVSGDVLLFVSRTP